MLERPILRTLALAVLLIVTALPVTAGYKEGVAAYKDGDYKTAVREFKTLAEAGNARAQYTLGVMYAKGFGVPKNYPEGIKWYRKSAEQGNALAQLNLGTMYGEGRGVPRNYVIAYMWWFLAAARGDEVAAKNLELVEKSMTRAQVAKAQALVAKWKPKKAKQTK